MEEVMKAFMQSTDKNMLTLKNATMANSRDVQELKSSIAKIEGQIGQLANQVGERERGISRVNLCLTQRGNSVLGVP
jgi:septal ring factor EnvC (AmiA/AmiB activator)